MRLQIKSTKSTKIVNFLDDIGAEYKPIKTYNTLYHPNLEISENRVSYTDDNSVIVKYES